jgi:uncharacterized delta-60 repeat protein
MKLSAYRTLGVMATVILALSPLAVAQVGELNHAFGSHGLTELSINHGNDSVACIAIYPATSVSNAGKVVLAGDGYESGKSQAVTEVLRLNADGSIDTGFGTAGVAKVYFGPDLINSCRGVAIQPDDKIVVLTEHRLSVAPNSQLGLGRFNADGAPDATFATNGKLCTTVGGLATYWYGVAIQKDGQIVVCGNTINYDSCIARVAANGSSTQMYTVDFTGFVGGSSWQELLYSITLDDGPSGAQNIYVTGTVMTADGSKYRADAVKFNTNGSVA